MTPILPRMLVAALVLAAVPMVAALVAQPLAASSELLCDLPKLPEGASVQVIGNDLVANGLPMAIAEVRHSISNAELLQHFRSLWAPDPDRPPLYVEYPMGVWSVIAHRKGGCFYTVQVRTQAMSLPALGILGIGRPEAAATASVMPQLDLPAGEILSHTQSRDQGRLADTWVIATTESVSGLARTLNEQLHLDGWTLLMTRNSDPSHSPINSDSRVLIYQRGMEDLGVAIGPGPQGVAAVVTHVLRGQP